MTQIKVTVSVAVAMATTMCTVNWEWWRCILWQWPLFAPYWFTLIATSCHFVFVLLFLSCHHGCLVFFYYVHLFLVSPSSIRSMQYIPCIFQVPWFMFSTFFFYVSLGLRHQPVFFDHYYQTMLLMNFRLAHIKLYWLYRLSVQCCI